MLISLLALACTSYLLYYFLAVSNRPTLVHADNPFTQQIIGACPSLLQPYRPPIWGFNCHIQILHMLFRQWLWRKSDFFTDSTRIDAPDGGLISIDWYGVDSHKIAQPIIIMLPTICGSSQDLTHHVRYLNRHLNWTLAVCNRRGHGRLQLASPKLNILGCMDDLDLQIDAVQLRFPDAPIYAYGLSAGTALLVRYLGRKGTQSRIVAAVANSPGYNTEVAFQRMPRPYNFIMTRKIKRYFLHRHVSVLADHEGYQSCLLARNMDDFHAHTHKLAGYASSQDFFADTNPMLSAADISVPLLVLNAKDDPVCVAKNVYEYCELIEQLPRCILALTKHGSHCAFWEGWLGRNSWSDRVAVQFFRAIAHQLPDSLQIPENAP